jgi:nucleoid DNA-binding protein
VTKSKLIEILATKSDGLSPTDAKLAVNIILNNHPLKDGWVRVLGD